MSNPMKYIKALEAAGFDRNQAEAQVQMVLDALEGDLVTKSDFAVFQERTDNRLTQFEQRMDARFAQERAYTDARFNHVDARFAKLEERIDLVKVTLRTELQILRKELEYNLTTRLGAMVLGTVSVAVAILAWLIKV